MGTKTFYANTWQRISLFVEPELFELVLSECQVVVLNHKLGVRYVEDRFAPYKLVSIYQDYVEAILTKSSRDYSDYQHLSRPELTSFKGLLANGDPDLTIPRLYISPEQIHYNTFRKQLMTNIGGNGELMLGMQINFAKTGTYDFGPVFDTSKTPNGELFALLKKTIMFRTKPCKFRSPSGIHRTSIRISDGIHERLKSHPMLAAHQLEVL